MATASTKIKVDSKLKKDAAALFSGLGLSLSDAVSIYLRQCVIRNGIPFSVAYPENAEPELKPTRRFKAAVREAEKIAKHPERYKGYTDLDEMWKDLGV